MVFHSGFYFASKHRLRIFCRRCGIPIQLYFHSACSSGFLVSSSFCQWYYDIRLMNNIRETKIKSYVLNGIKVLQKPFFAFIHTRLFICTRFISQLLTWFPSAIIVSMQQLFPNSQIDMLAPCLNMLGVVFVHIVLIYRVKWIDWVYLHFTRNPHWPIKGCMCIRQHSIC